MKKKTIAISVIISVFLIGIVSAGLIDYFGRITGSVTVEGPLFYLDGNVGGAYYKLLVNEEPENEEEINWINGETIKFKTEALGIDYFYKTKFNFIFYAKTNHSGSNIQMRITKLNEDGSQGNEICISGTKEITTSSYSDYGLGCSSLGEIDIDEDQGFVLEVFGLSENETDQYWISTGKEYTNEYSRVEVEYIE